MTIALPDGPDAVTAALELARTATKDALTIAGATRPGTDVVPTGADAAVAVKVQMAAKHAEVAKARKTAIAAQSRAKEAIRAQQAELEARLHAMAAELEPLQAQIALLNEGIWTMNLYLGRDEEIHTLTEGEPAPAGTPVHVRQQVLAMDEESALAADTGGIDVRSIETFDEWITAEPAHLEQILPEQRGVVAIMARRRDRDYGDPWANVELNTANHETWWLIRNGQNLYRMLTNFETGRRLVPARNEFTSMFVDRFTKQPLQPGTRAWLDAEKAASKRERHFMRIALILQGLIDRTAVFHPLPIAGLSLLAPDHYDAGHVVLIADDENQLTTGRTPFYRWIAAKNALLTPGMRVIVNPAQQSWPDRGGGGDAGRHPRLHPPRAECPSPTQVHIIKKRGDGGALTFTYPRTQEEWIRGKWGSEELRVPSTPATCTIYPDDQFVLPIDLVTVADMREYLSARTERHAYADMFPTLNAAIAFKEAEAAQEAPFRSLLARQIATADNTTIDEATTLVDDLVAWWKIGNRWHRPLNGDPAAEAKAARMILTEHNARRRAADTGETATVLDHLRAKHPGALFIARKKDGTWVVATASPRRWARPVDEKSNRFRTQVAPLDVFVDVTEYTKTGRSRQARTWQVLEPSVVSRWTMLHSTEGWEGWNRRARRSEHLSDPEIEAAVAEFQARPAPAGHQLIAVMYDEVKSWHNDQPEFTLWYQPADTPQVPQRRLTEKMGDPVCLTQDVTWKRSKDGTVELTYRRKPSSSNVNYWRPTHNTIIDGTVCGTVVEPWAGDNRSHQIVFLDEQVHTAAVRGAQVWETNRAAIARLNVEANRLIGSIERAWLERATAQAKARFMEDYADESLWDDHAKSLKITVPFGARSSTEPKEYRGTRAALDILVRRLTEDDLAPYRLTIREAIADLGEDLVTLPGTEWTHDSGGKVVTVAEDVLDLRFTVGPASQ